MELTALADHVERVDLMGSRKDTVVVVEDSLVDRLLVDIRKVVDHRHLEDSGCHSLDMHEASEALLQVVEDTVRVGHTFAVVMLER